ncbi:MAG: hypothetical protein KGI54_08685 [Pseudomonadota bacterium]|nr:hypothetical protein [Pseudomonadota bacterium]
MGIGKQSAPAAPDYASAANATAAGNLEAAKYATKANRANQITPYGSLTWVQGKDANGKDNNEWTQSINLNDVGQRLLDQSNRTSEGLAGLQDAATARVGQTMGHDIPGSYDPTQATNNAADLLNARLLPQQQRDQEMMDTKLANQGITQGSEAWKNAQADLGRTQNDARMQAQLQGINLGQAQQAQQYAQALTNRNLPMNELNAIRTGSQVTNPTFSNYAQQATTQGADLLGAANSQYGAANNAANAANAGIGNTMSGLFGIGAAGLGNNGFITNMFKPKP